jgi:transposase
VAGRRTLTFPADALLQAFSPAECANNFAEGVIWIVRTGSPWRDLPEAFGDWNSVFRRFSRWSLKGVWWRIFEAMSDDPDFEYLIVDSTIVRAHQHAAGAKKGGLKIRRSAVRAAA